MDKQSPLSAKKLWSNRAIAAIAIGLGLIIVLDGVLLNKPDSVSTIYSIDDPRSISLSQDDTLLIAFERQHGQWLVTEPQIAPAMAARMAVLLDANNYTSRSYPATELPYAELFENAVSLRIDDNLFSLGQLEPVSQLRYVYANKQVYLQPDFIMPLLQAGYNAFTDLLVTAEVSEVSIDNKAVENIQLWSELQSIGIVRKPDTNVPALASITVIEKDKPPRTFNLYSQGNGVTLVDEGFGYGYLLAPEQTAALGLSNLLSPAAQ
ncbi:hypothetical protein AB833_29945 [Chromatiales bacterium (ex Bugula neritina AB1)]|nr:hypothetical protein AB833_29945 [Chromatiales bacterium (ex Bugula neritina AB1)]